MIDRAVIIVAVFALDAWLFGVSRNASTADMLAHGLGVALAVAILLMIDYAAVRRRARQHLEPIPVRTRR